jgi:hypothetical protein
MALSVPKEVGMTHRTILLTCLLIGILTIGLSAALAIGGEVPLGGTSTLSAEPGQYAATSLIVDSKVSKEHDVRSVDLTVESCDLPAGVDGEDSDGDAAERIAQEEESVFETCNRGSLNHRPQD